MSLLKLFTSSPIRFTIFLARNVPSYASPQASLRCSCPGTTILGSVICPECSVHSAPSPRTVQSSHWSALGERCFGIRSFVPDGRQARGYPWFDRSLKTLPRWFSINWQVLIRLALFNLDIVIFDHTCKAIDHIILILVFEDDPRQVGPFLYVVTGIQISAVIPLKSYFLPLLYSLRSTVSRTRKYSPSWLICWLRAIW